LNEEPKIDALREEIENVTIEILRLVGQRLFLAKKLGKKKLLGDLPIEDIEVERRLRQKALGRCEAFGLRLSFGLRLLNLLIEEAKIVQNEVIRGQNE
jgi:aspartate aminotransferase